MGGVQFQVVKEHKDLGILMDKDLKFHSHSCNVTNKARQMLGIIKKTFTYLGSHTLLLLYKSLVLPHLEYMNVIWGPSFLFVGPLLYTVPNLSASFFPAGYLFYFCLHFYST